MTNKLTEFLRNHAKKFESQKEFAAQIGIGADHLNHIVSGRMAVSAKAMGQILEGLAHDSSAQTHALCAYLMDRIPEDFDKLVRILPSHESKGSVKEDGAAYGNDAAARLGKLIRDPYFPVKLTETLEKLAIVGIDCPELRLVLQDLTKLEIKPKK